MPFSTVVASPDTISHFAFGIGDDNPLWHDPDYGKTTRWRGQISPPLYATTVGLDDTPPPTPELKKLFKACFARGQVLLRSRLGMVIADLPGRCDIPRIHDG